ncbi:competence protein ComG [Priestia megaterium]|nr:competence protein ComG [Priestia megaterium]
MLVVLFIVQIIAFSVIVNLRPLMDYYRMTTFLRQLQVDTFYVQQVAMTNEVPVKIVFHPEQSEYVILRLGKTLSKRKYDDGLTILFGSGLTSIQYNEKGNISQPKSMFISNSKVTYKVTFQIGRGRFYVQEL